MLEDINRFDDCYQIIKNKKTSKIISFITILLIIIIIFLVYFFCYKFKITKSYYGSIIRKEENYVYCKILSNHEFVYFKNNKTILVINNDEVNYEIVDIINNEEYNEVILKLQLNYEPRILKLKFILNKKTLFEKMKEGLLNE